MSQSNAQLKDTLKKIRKLIGKSVLEDNIKDSILVPIPIIEDKIDTEQIHVGLIGESSRESVSVLNSLLNTDFFKEHQGSNQRRMVRTLIEYAPQEKLAVTLANGKVYNTRNNMLRLTREFLPDRYSEFSFFDKFKYFFGFHNDTSKNARLVGELYHKLVSSKDAQEQVSSMRLGLPSESLPPYLVIVDNPSFDPTNGKSQKVLRETVKILCDELILLAPSDNPLSDYLVSFLKANPGSYKDTCHVFLTGLEKHPKKEKRAEILFSTSMKADMQLKIPSERVIVAPAALDLALKGISTHLSSQELNALPPEERQKLLQQYKRDIENCFTLYNIRKETAVVEKKFSVVEQYILFIRKLIEDSTKNNDEQIQQLKKQMVPQLEKFLRNFNSRVDVRSKTKNVGENVIEECKGYMKDFLDSIFRVIDLAANRDNPKDAIQGIMKDSSVVDTGNRTCAKCYQSYIFKFDYVKGVYRDVFVRLESDLRKTYGITDANLKIGERIKPIGSIPYDMDISKRGMTTFSLKRLFTSVSTIQAQMKSAIQTASFKFFGSVAGTYSNELSNTCKELDSEADHLRNDILRRYKRPVEQRIADINAKEKALRDTNSSLASLKDLVTKSIGYDIQ